MSVTQEVAQLHAASRHGVGLGEIVAATRLGGAYGLLYAFDRCALVRVVDGVVHEAVRTGDRYVVQPADLDGVYEARVFCEAGEIRWVRRGLAGAGTAAWVGNPPPEGFDGEPDDDAPAIVGTLDTEYVLWGTTTDVKPAEGWCEVAAAQVGALAVPVPHTAAGQAVVLQGCEYLGEDGHGNVSVVEERLTGLRAGPAEGTS